MKKIFILILTGLITMSINAELKDGLYAEFKTNKGNFTCRLFYKEVPIVVANFTGLAEGTLEFTDIITGSKVKRPFYNGIIFHRVISGFMIQGGCPLGKGTGGPGYSFIDQFNDKLKHNKPGILSMANAGPNTNGSQFFITVAPTPHLDAKHAVFGEVVENMDVVMNISKVKTGPNDKPVDNVIINEIKIIRVGEEAKAFDAVKEFAKIAEIEKKQNEELNKKRDEFLSKLGVKKDKIIKTQSGLEYYVIKEGSGNTPNIGDKIVANYAGYLVDGKKFDSSYDRGQAFSTQIGVGRVIKGWDEAFLTMKKGEKRILIIPYYLAYGERGHPGVIPPKATLIFEVELLDIVK